MSEDSRWLVEFESWEDLFAELYLHDFAMCSKWMEYLKGFKTLREALHAHPTSDFSTTMRGEVYALREYVGDLLRDTKNLCTSRHALDIYKEYVSKNRGKLTQAEIDMLIKVLRTLRFPQVPNGQD